MNSRTLHAHGVAGQTRVPTSRVECLDRDTVEMATPSPRAINQNATPNRAYRVSPMRTAAVRRSRRETRSSVTIIAFTRPP
jgi:hypothetical protein